MAKTVKTATERMDIARAAHQETKAEIVLLASILSRVWPSWVSPPLRPDGKFPKIVCIESPAGRLTYRLAEDELSAFEHLDERPNDAVACSTVDRRALLNLLATEGW